MTTIGTRTTDIEGLTQASARQAGRGTFARRLVRPAAGLATIAIVGLLGWSLLGFGGPGPGNLPGQSFGLVLPRTFTVVLKEKGELQAAHSTDITCDVEGKSTIISLVEEGKAVEKGDLLVELASDEIVERIRETELKEANAITAFEAAKAELDIQRDKNASDIRKAKLKIELTQLELDKYEKGEWKQTLKDSQIAIDEAKITLERRRQDHEASKELLVRSFTTQTEYQEAEFRHQKAVWDLEKAIGAMHVLKVYTHVADLRKRQSDLEEAEKEHERAGKSARAEETKKARKVEGTNRELELIQDKLASLKKQQSHCRIEAPARGFVVYYSGGGRHFFSSDNQIKEGATVRERQVLMQLPDTSQMIVAVRIHEAKTDRLKLGQRVRIEVEGFPDRQFTGKVAKIAVLADTQNRWLNPDLKEYETEILLDPTDATLKPGVTAHVEIIVETVENALTVPVQSIYSKGGQRYVFTKSRSGVKPAPVTLGAIGTVWAQITDGVTANQSVLLAFTDRHKRLLPEEVVASTNAHGGKSARKAKAAGGHGKASRASAHSPHGKRSTP